MSALIVSSPSLQDKVAALNDPSIYPDAPWRVESIETHCAWVFLTDSHAYKLKKPMRLDRMNNLLLAARHGNCLEELRLNRRLAPDVYIDVISLKTTPTGRLCLDSEGTPVEWLVKMRRLPAALLLDHAIAAQTVTRASIRAAGQLLAGFYSRQPSIAIAAADYCHRLAAQTDANRAALLSDDLGLPAELVDAVAMQQRRFLDRRSAALMQRAERGRIIEAHGDLKPEHFYLGSPPCVIDCLEFDRDLRLLDPLEELAFFSLECERLGAAWIGEEILSIYARMNEDPVDLQLFEFYLSRRATRRAVTAAWHLRDPLVRGTKDWRRLAVSYLKRPLQGCFEF